MKTNNDKAAKVISDFCIKLNNKNLPGLVLTKVNCILPIYGNNHCNLEMPLNKSILYLNSSCANHFNPIFYVNDNGNLSAKITHPAVSILFIFSNQFKHLNRSKIHD